PQVALEETPDKHLQDERIRAKKAELQHVPEAGGGAGKAGAPEHGRPAHRQGSGGEEDREQSLDLDRRAFALATARHGLAVVGVKLLLVNVRPVLEQGPAAAEPLGVEIRVHRWLWQGAGVVPPQPVQVEDVLVPQSARSLAEEPDIQPARQEGERPNREYLQ